MRKIANRAFVLGVLAAISTSLALPGYAAADTDPALAGDCAKTLGADSGEALTLDAGAPLNQPGLLTLGTGSRSANTPALHVDLANVTSALNVKALPGTATVANVCTGAQGVVNALSATTQSLLGGGPITPAPPGSGSPKPPKPPKPPSKPAPTPPPAGEGAGSSADSTDLGTVQVVSFPLNATSPSSPSDLGSLISPVAIAPLAQGVIPPTGTSPGEVPSDSGSAQALPAVSAGPAKLPLLLAAIAVALAAAALAHVWLRRRPS
ncbi:hypothetical protein [Amycolatopsis sp. GM8]|uniref:hypothetical protein n=1 Tax=Amycolatopsis sp. GM8 TaxID=2896530 RepID=UPI001F2D0B01|nr:hypothetical protein [Amycolatopsis sp. GM8]